MTIIGRLEKKSLVARLPKQEDKRLRLIAISVKGAELLEETPEPLYEQLSIKLEQLSPEKFQKLQESFDIIIDFLNIEKIDAAPIITAGTDIPATE